MSQELLTEIRAFLAETKMGPTYFGKRAARDSSLIERLENGGRCWPETEARIREFMAERLAKREQAA